MLTVGFLSIFSVKLRNFLSVLSLRKVVMSQCVLFHAFWASMKMLLGFLFFNVLIDGLYQFSNACPAFLNWGKSHLVIGWHILCLHGRMRYADVLVWISAPVFVRDAALYLSCDVSVRSQR